MSTDAAGRPPLREWSSHPVLRGIGTALCWAVAAFATLLTGLGLRDLRTTDAVGPDLFLVGLFSGVAALFATMGWRLRPRRVLAITAPPRRGPGATFGGIDRGGPRADEPDPHGVRASVRGVDFRHLSEPTVAGVADILAMAVDVSSWQSRGAQGRAGVEACLARLRPLLVEAERSVRREHVPDHDIEGDVERIRQEVAALHAAARRRG